MVPSPVQIDIPPLQTFTFIPVTGKVIARTVASSPTANVSASASSEVDPPSDAAKAQGKKKAGSSKDGGPGSKNGDAPPVTPKGGEIDKEEDEDDDDEDGEDDPNEEGEEDLDAELAALEGMESETTTPKKRKKTKHESPGEVPKKKSKNKKDA